MNFNLLMQALLRGSLEDVGRQLNGISDAMEGYLMVRMRADKHDAQDAVQQTLLILLERSKNGQLMAVKNPGNYIRTVLRNEYFRVVRKPADIASESIEEYSIPVNDPDQLEALVTKERLEILRDCISRMTESNKRFMDYCMSRTRIEAAELARKFKITITNAWTRKHRIIQWLARCFERRSTEREMR